MEKRLAFTGPYADINFGDYAMLVNNIRALRAKSATIFTYNSAFLNKIQNRYLHSVDTTLVEFALDPAFLVAVSRGYVPTQVELVDAVVERDVLLATLDTVDSIVVTGGGYINGLWAMPHRIERLLRILAPAIAGSFLGKSVVFTGNGYGPFGDSRELFVSLIGTLQNAVFGVRDSVFSPGYLHDLGIAKSSINLVPDDLYLLDQTLVPPARTAATSNRPYVVLETYLPVSELRARAESIVGFVRMLEDRGLGVVFLPFNEGNGGVQQGVFLKNLCPGIQVYDFDAVGFLPIEDAVEVIRGAEFVVCSRYHAVVLALAVGTPVMIGLRKVMGDTRYYYGKSLGILQHALPGANFLPSLFIGTDLFSALERVTSELDGLIHSQRGLFLEHRSSGIARSRAARTALLGKVK